MTRDRSAPDGAPNDLKALAPIGLAYLNVAHQRDEELLAELRSLWPGTLVLNRGDADVDRREQDIEYGVAEVTSLARLTLASPDIVERQGSARR